MKKDDLIIKEPSGNFKKPSGKYFGFIDLKRRKWRKTTITSMCRVKCQTNLNIVKDKVTQAMISSVCKFAMFLFVWLVFTPD